MNNTVLNVKTNSNNTVTKITNSFDQDVTKEFEEFAHKIKADLTKKEDFEKAITEFAKKFHNTQILP